MTVGTVREKNGRDNQRLENTNQMAVDFECGKYGEVMKSAENS